MTCRKTVGASEAIPMEWRSFPLIAPRLFILLLLLLVPVASGQDRPMALRGATIETVGDAGRIDRGTIVILDGKIQSVGPWDQVEIPDDARVIDTSGRTIMPGLVEPAYRYNPISGGGSGSRTVTIRGQTVTLPAAGGAGRGGAFTRMADAFDPYRNDFKELPRSGLTYLNLLSRDHGQSALIRLTPEQPDTMLAEPDGVLFASLTNTTPSLSVIRSGLQSASRRGGSAASSRPESGSNDRAGGTSDSGSPGSGAASTAPSSASDLWRAVREGKTPLFIDANNAAAILYLLDILKGHPDVHLILAASGSDIYRTLDQLRGRKVSVILRPAIDRIPNTDNRINVARMVHEAGFDLAFSTASDRGALRFSQDAPLFPVALLVKAGLPRDVALEALTRQPATLLGFEETIGSIEPGKSASLLIFDGDPLDPYSRLRQVLMEGSMVYED